MKRLRILIAILTGISILACSSDNNDTEEIDNDNSEVIIEEDSDETNDDDADETNDPIVGVWNQIRSFDMFDDEIIVSNSDSCARMNTQTFNSDQTYSYNFFDNEFSDCTLAEESVSGDWNRSGDFYDINFMYRQISTGEIFDGNEDIEYESRDIFIQNDTLKIRFNFIDESTTVEYIK